MVPPQSAMTTTELVALRARQPQKRQEDLDTIWDQVIKARFTSIHQVKKKYANMIHAYQFVPSNLVLVRNSRVEASLDRKTKPLDRSYGNSISDNPQSLHPCRNGRRYLQTQVCHLLCYPISCLTEDEHRSQDFFCIPLHR
jgi:hypothetical protein